MISALSARINPSFAQTAPAAQPQAPAQAPVDKVETGGQAPSRLATLLRGGLACVGGVAVGTVFAGVRGVQHAADQSIEVSPKLSRPATWVGAGTGLALGVLSGLSGGPLGAIAMGAFGLFAGAFVGGGTAAGLVAVHDALKGAKDGAVEGFHKGASGVKAGYDKLTGYGRPSAPTPTPTPPTP